MVKKKKIVIYSERDRYIFNNLLNFISAGLIAFGIEKIISNGFVVGWWYESAAAFLIILINYTFVNKKSNKIK
jgi:hypothetical protein